MSNRSTSLRCSTPLVCVVAWAAHAPAQATDWNAVSKGLNQMGQQLQTYSDQQRRQEQEQERLRLQQEQLELQRQKLQAAEKERQAAQQQVREAEQRTIQGERMARAEAEKAKRVAEQTPPDDFSHVISIHRATLLSHDSRASCQTTACDSTPSTRLRDKTDSRSLILDRLSETPEHVELMNYLKLTSKDPFETTDAWRKRADALRLNHRISLRLGTYDADQGRFEADFGGIPMSLPLPPEVARTLADTKSVDVEGELKVIDASFFELANPKVLLPDGKTHAVVPKACPKTLAEILPALPAFQYPRLAKLRKQILATSVTDTLEKARQAGFDRKAAIAATEEQRDQYFVEAERIRTNQDPAIAADVRNYGKLPLNYPCQGPKRELVCRYIEQFWRTMAADAMAWAMACR